MRARRTGVSRTWDVARNVKKNGGAALYGKQYSAKHSPCDDRRHHSQQYADDQVLLCGPVVLLVPYHVADQTGQYPYEDVPEVPEAARFR